MKDHIPIHKRCACTMIRFKLWHWVLGFFLLLGLTLVTKAQTRVDSAFAFQTDPNKKYSLYIPAAYDSQVPNGMMVGMHPFNTNRWDAISWCDTLLAFAEINGLILACPDGGVDGQVDDQIDTAFTSALIDSMRLWYNIDQQRTYIMGFSWGGLATYTYGLNNPQKFCGYMPIGAAISSNTVSPALASKAKEKPVYIVHGSQDSPNSRYWPALNILTDSNAIVNSRLMSGVGHTIDFPNRNEILTEAFEWIDSVCLAGPPIAIAPGWEADVRIFPTVMRKNTPVRIILGRSLNTSTRITVWNLEGRQVATQQIKAGATETLVPTSMLRPGVYLLYIRSGNAVKHQKILVN